MEKNRCIQPVLALVVPCFNESAVVADTAKRLNEALSDLIRKALVDPGSFIFFVDDGSSDETWTLLAGLKPKGYPVRGIRLSRNYGHQRALLSGLLQVRERCDCAISLDADLQDDVGVLAEFLERYKAGSEIVYGVRKSRTPDTPSVRLNAFLFYGLMRRMGADVLDQHADFRLTSRRVLDALEEYREADVFLRGIFPSMGFRHAVVYYDRHPRVAGKSKYTFKKMLAFALDGITSSSVVPLRLISFTGLVILAFSSIAILYALFRKVTGGSLDSWFSTMPLLLFISGVQLLGLGIIGEYTGRIYREARKRPRYIIEEEF